MADAASSVVIFVINLLIGAIGIYAGAQLLIDRDVEFSYAAVTALIGAIVWAIVSFFFGWIPILGALLTLVAWVGVINWRFPGGWGTAAAVGFTAWVVAVIVLYALALFSVITFDALGIPAA